MRRVVITGAGAISALGQSARDNYAAMREGRCGIGELSFRDVDRLSIRIGGQIRDYDETAHFSRSQIAILDRFTQYALLSSREALDEAGLEISEAAAHRAGVIIGTSGGGLHTQDDSYRLVYEEGKNRVHPFIIPRLMNNAAASQISMAHGLKGPSYCVATACASSNHAIGQAFHLIRSGTTDIMVTGGSESMLVFGGIKAWEGLRVMSKDGCRPFCKSRNGMVQGEGAAIFVLEEYESARARGAVMLAEICGFAMTSDASDIVMPSQEGATRAIAGALDDARMGAEEVGYINAHGTGTAANDRTECAAVRQAFGSHADKLMISSTKSMHGHLIGGTGAVEMLAVLMALRDGVVAPTIGYAEPDPACDLDVVPNEAREIPVRAALSNAFAFGGLNAVLALRSI